MAPGLQLLSRARTETGFPSEPGSLQAAPVAELLRRALREGDHAWPKDVIESAAEAIEEVALKYNFSPALVLSLIQHESDFRLDAVSPSGAVGLTQILPSTAIEAAVALGFRPPSKDKLFDPGTNIRLGFSYLASLRNAYGSLDAALAVYRGGPDAAKGRTAADLASWSYMKKIRETERAMTGWMKTP